MNAALNRHALKEKHPAGKTDQAGKEILNMARTKLGISMRGYHRLLRVARTLADLEGKEVTEKHHITEALAYRCDFDRPT